MKKFAITIGALISVLIIFTSCTSNKEAASPSSNKVTSSKENYDTGIVYSKNLYYIKLEEAIRETEPTLIRVKVPEFSSYFIFDIEGTKKETKYTYRRLMKGNIQKSYKPIREEVVTEMSPRYVFQGTLPGNMNQDFLKMRMLELEREGETRLFDVKGYEPDFDLENTWWDQAILYLDGKKSIEFQYHTSYFYEKPSLEFLLYYAKVLEVDYLEDEIKQAYEDVLINNKKEYRSPEVVALMHEGRFAIYFQDMELLLKNTFVENKVIARMLKSTAFQEKFYPDPMVLYEKYKETATVIP